MTLVNLSKKQKAIVKKESKKWKILHGSWNNFGLKKMPKHLKLTKIDYIVWGIFVFYFIYYCNDFSYVIDYNK